MSMTAADALRSAEPPVDDGGIDKALADLDVKIWTWTDAMLTARAAIKRSLAHKEIFSRGGEFTIGPDAAGVAPVMTAAGAMSPPAPSPVTPDPAVPAAVSPFDAQPLDAPQPPPAFGSNWDQPQQPEQPAAQGSFVQQAASSSGEWAPAGSMQWPSADSKDNQGSGDVVPLAWPSVPSQGNWAPAEKPGTTPPPAASSKPAERARKPAPPRLSPEEAEARAERAAREEAMLAALDETSARRVRLLRRLDPDADIEQLIEKASQTQSREAEKPNDKASWWRRK